MSATDAGAVALTLSDLSVAGHAAWATAVAILVLSAPQVGAAVIVLAPGVIVITLPIRLLAVDDGTRTLRSIDNGTRSLAAVDDGTRTLKALDIGKHRLAAVDTGTRTLAQVGG